MRIPLPTPSEPWTRIRRATPSEGWTARVFVLPADGRRQTGLLIETPTSVQVFRNRCPHWSVPLDSNSSDIQDGDALACSIHGARFDPLTGKCSDGPCEGASLTELPSELDGEFVVVLRPLLTT